MLRKIMELNKQINDQYKQKINIKNVQNLTKKQLQFIICHSF